MRRIAWLALVTAGWLSWQGTRPPAPVGKDAPPGDFSSARAKQHIERIASQPHPLGSAAHDEVRDYLLKTLRDLGGEAQLQTGSVLRGHRSASLTNIVGRWKGTRSRKAVLLMSHYDSAVGAPGASDAGSGVATILETVRAARAGPALANDLMVLLTDGEEAGLLGAELFVKEHPWGWTRQPGVVLNFEARGSGGPAAMFETSRENGWLIRKLAAAAPYPLANSLSGEIYRRMPNDSDLSVFKRRGFAGLNFAYIGNHLTYHTALDDVSHLEESSLQHLGSYALSLVRRLGTQDLSRVEEENRVYFSVGPVLFHYPEGWVVTLTQLVAGAFAAFLMDAVRRGVVRWKGLAQGLVAYLAVLALAPALVALAWQALGWLKPDYHSLIHGDTYNRSYYVWGFGCLSAAVMAGVCRLVGRRVNVLELMAGPLLVWSALAAVSAAWMPGASYFFMWPLAAGTVGFAVVALRRGAWWVEASAEGQPRPAEAAAITLCALPAVAILVPQIDLLWVAMTLRWSWAGAAAVVLLLGLLAAHVAMLEARERWWPAGVALAASMILLSAGLVTANFSREHPRHDSVFYALDADSGTARWASADRKPDEWTSQFFPEAPRGPVSGFPNGRFLNGPAPAVKLAAPEVLVLDDRRAAGTREVRLQVRSVRGAGTLMVWLDPAAPVQWAEMNGKKVEGLGGANRGGTLTYLAAPKDGASLVLGVAAGQPVRLTVADQSFGLPAELAGKYRPRPPHIIPMHRLGSVYSDSIVVARTVTL
jgi:hypothetical protein